MTRKAFLIMFAIQGACAAGPDQAQDYRGPAVTINARFFDLPSTDIVGAQANIYAVAFCNAPAYQQPDLKEVPVGDRTPETSPFVADHLRFDVLGDGGDSGPARCGYSSNELRFFRVHSFLEESTGSFGTWSPTGYDLVYSPSATTFSPFGPNGPSVAFPRGYSWLRRTCGSAPGLIDMAVVSTDETVDFHFGQNPGTFPGEIDQSELALVETCGAIPATADLGARISFDRAQALVWSADGASIYYLAPADPQDPTQSVSLRQLRLADAATSEVVGIPFGQGLQGDSTGKLYVGNGNNGNSLFRVDTSSSPASLLSIPIRWDAVPSPDGRWLAYVASTPSGNETWIWDVQSGANLTSVNGSFGGWSPDSTLAYWSYTAPSTFTVLSPAGLDQPKTYGTNGNSIPAVVWSTEGPLLAQRPLAWSIQSGHYPACDACFGLSLQDPVTGADRPVLDASAGMIDIAPTHPVLGLMLVWRRTCLGLYNTVCSYSLMLVDLANTKAAIVAVAASEVPVTVAPDNRRIALATPSGIYVKSLAP